MFHFRDWQNKQKQKYHENASGVYLVDKFMHLASDISRMYQL